VGLRFRPQVHSPLECWPSPPGLKAGLSLYPSTFIFLLLIIRRQARGPGCPEVPQGFAHLCVGPGPGQAAATLHEVPPLRPPPIAGLEAQRTSKLTVTVSHIMTVREVLRSCLTTQSTLHALLPHYGIV
jgi:hypothetical protein